MFITLFINHLTKGAECGIMEFWHLSYVNDCSVLTNWEKCAIMKGGKPISKNQTPVPLDKSGSLWITSVPPHTLFSFLYYNTSTAASQA